MSDSLDPKVAGTGANPAQNLLNFVRSIPNKVRIGLKDAQDGREATLAPSARERQAHLLEFYDRYEQVVEVLVDAAQFGPNDILEAKYQMLRRYMEENYEAVRPFAVAYLRLSVEDEAFGISVCGKGTDAFQTLTAAPDLATLLAKDDGEMISRITRTREALTLYGEHLRYLLSRSD